MLPSWTLSAKPALRPGKPQTYIPSAPTLARIRPGAADITVAQGRPTIVGCAIMASRTRFGVPGADVNAARARAIARRGSPNVGALQPSIPIWIDDGLISA